VSLALLQSPNIVLLLAAVAAFAVHLPRAWLPVLISTLGFIAAAWWSWAVLLAERHEKPHRESDIKWGEAFALAGLAASGLLLVQLARLWRVCPPPPSSPSRVWRSRASWARSRGRCSGSCRWASGSACCRVSGL